jgi:hypothetical protein
MCRKKSHKIAALISTRYSSINVWLCLGDAAVLPRLQVQDKSVWLLIWDNASWHESLQARTWIREHNQQVRQDGKGVGILPFCLPTKSPWLNPIEPKWLHGKRNVVEHEGVLMAQQLAVSILATRENNYSQLLESASTNVAVARISCDDAPTNTSNFPASATHSCARSS